MSATTFPDEIEITQRRRRGPETKPDDIETFGVSTATARMRSKRFSTVNDDIIDTFAGDEEFNNQLQRYLRSYGMRASELRLELLEDFRDCDFSRQTALAEKVLSTALSSPTSFSRIGAIELLAGINAEALVSMFIRTFESRPASEDRLDILAGAIARCTFEPRLRIRFLAKLLDSKNPYIRETGVSELGRFQDSILARQLVVRQSKIDSDPLVREVAIEFLNDSQ